MFLLPSKNILTVCCFAVHLLHKPHAVPPAQESLSHRPPLKGYFLITESQECLQKLLCVYQLDCEKDVCL